jgi:hypothetical protein
MSNAVVLDLSPAVVNLKAARGDTWRVRFRFYEALEDGTPNYDLPVDLSSGSYSAQVRLRETDALLGTASIDDAEAASGILDLVVAHGDTASAPLGRSLAYDVQQDAGDERLTLITGTVRVIADWTRDA